MRDQILSFLAQGFSKEAVLKAIGCSEDLYTEIVGDESFIRELAAKKDEERQTRIDRHYDGLEEKVLTRLKTELEFLDTPQLCKVLDTVARNKQAYRKPANTLQNPTAHLSVTVNIPQPGLNQRVTLDSNNQVVAIGERVMTALPLQGVKALFDKLENPDKDPVKELRDDLEISATSPA